MILQLAFASAYLIKSLITEGYIGLLEHKRSLVLTGFKDAIDVEIQPYNNTAAVKISAPGFGYLSLVGSKIEFSKQPTPFSIFYSFNGGFLISQKNNCIAHHFNQRIEMKPCKGHSNKFLILRKTSKWASEEIKLKFLRNFVKTTKNLSTEAAYGRVNSMDLLLKIERYLIPKFYKPETNERRDFIKINEF